MSRSIRQVVIRGKVQGVGFRAWVEHQARAHGLEGWVRNRRDGSVEALFSGPAEIIAEMTALCRRGPSLARVEAVTDEAAGVDALNLRRPGEGFSVLPTVVRGISGWDGRGAATILAADGIITVIFVGTALAGTAAKSRSSASRSWVV